MADNFGTIALDVGELIVNEGEAGALSVGFTQGGSFTDGATFRSIEVDGKRAPLVGDKVADYFEPVLAFNVLQMESANLDALFSGITIVDATGVKTLTRSLTVSSDDYLTNVTWVGKSKDGKDRKIKLINALGTAPLSFTFADKTEIQIPCSFMGHNADKSVTTAPYTMTIDESV